MHASRVIDKSLIFEALVRRVTEDLATMESAQRQTVSGVVHEDSRAENDKDTRGLESSYLARGQAARVVELRDALAKLHGLALRPFGAEDPIALGALVTLDDDSEQRRYFLAPAGGGLDVEVDGERILIVTPASPVGHALLGKHEEDDVEIRTPQGAATWSIAGVS